MPRVLIVRGQLATPWELRPWAALPERFEVSYLLTRSNEFDTESLPLRAEPVTALRDRCRWARGRPGRAGVSASATSPTPSAAYARADVVHAEELSFWFAADAARPQGHGTATSSCRPSGRRCPSCTRYRSRHARRYRDEVLAATDLFLPATERAREALLLEGVEDERIVVCPPGIDLDRFGARAEPPPAEHVILSPGRLVWEKGHQDVLRAVALLARDGLRPRVRIVGRGPEEERLRAHARRAGARRPGRDRPRCRYDEMPGPFASASCMVLASLPSASCAAAPVRPAARVLGGAVRDGAGRGDGGRPRRARLPERCDPRGARRAGHAVRPGRLAGLARLLAARPARAPAGGAGRLSAELVRRYSTAAMAERLAAAYERVLAA